MKKSTIVLLLVAVLALAGTAVVVTTMNSNQSKKATSSSAETKTVVDTDKKSTADQPKDSMEKKSDSTEKKDAHSHEGHDHKDHEGHDHKDHDHSDHKDEMKKAEKAAMYVSHADYKANMSAYKDTKRVYFFHAKWCSVCQQLDKELKADTTKLPKGTTVIMVDFDKELDLRKKYGVTNQTTFVQVGADDAKVAKWNAASLSTVIAGIK